MAKNTLVTRFAPSPTGFLHLGHVRSALTAWRIARDRGGRFLLRIEDIDGTRCRPEFEQAILEDLAWLGLRWETPVRRQSEHFDDYAAALDYLSDQGLIYPCFCTRRQIREEIARAGSAPHQGGVGPVYPGTCRTLSEDERLRRIANEEPYALRLDMAAAIASLAGAELEFEDELTGTVRADPSRFGDIVLARKETPTSYHLAVTLDDAMQGVTLVVRGSDLFENTHVHRLLQALLHLPVPLYHHHALVMDPDTGKQLSKRDGALSLASLREAGRTPEEVIEKAMAGGESP